MDNHTASQRPSAGRDVAPAILDGLRSKCPSCHKGSMFGKWLKVQDECANCGEELHHHRADDFPPYLVIVIVSHIVITLVMVVEAQTDWSTWMHLALFGPLTIILSLVLLQPIKGGVVGLQWALGMHGFDGTGSE